MPKSNLKLKDSASRLGYTYSKQIAVLHDAAFTGQNKVLIKLLKCSDIDVNARTNDGFTALYFAAQEGHAEVIRILVEVGGADVNIIDNRGITPLLVAIIEGHTDAVKTLLNMPGIDINGDDEAGDTPLIVASQNSNVEIVRALLDAPGIDLTAANKEGMTAIHWAAYEGQVDVLRTLLQASHQSINATDQDRSTALILAATRNHLDAVKELLKIPSLDLNAVNSHGDTALRDAVFRNRLQMVKVLLADKRVNIDTANSLLIDASVKGYVEIVRVLLAVNGIDVTSTDTDESLTALHLSVQEGHVEVVRLLLAAPGIEVNAFDYVGMTALHWAVHEGHLEVVRLLLAAPDIDVNAIELDGLTALHWAVHQGNIEAVRALLDAPNINMNMPIQQPLDEETEEGLTPIQLALQYGQNEIVDLLRERGAHLTITGDLQVNPPQSTHTYTVHESVGKSIKAMLKHYESKNLDLAAAYQSLLDWGETLKVADTAPIIDKKRAAKSFLAEDARQSFVESSTNVSLRDFLGLVWLVIHDKDELSEEEGKTEESANQAFHARREQLIWCFYECRRGDNLDKHNIDNGLPDDTICSPGIYNKLIEGLVGLSRFAHLIIVTKDTITAKATSLVGRAFRDLSIDMRQEIGLEWVKERTVPQKWRETLSSFVLEELHKEFDAFQSKISGYENLLLGLVDNIEYFEPNQEVTDWVEAHRPRKNGTPSFTPAYALGQFRSNEAEVLTSAQKDKVLSDSDNDDDIPPRSRNNTGG